MGDHNPRYPAMNPTLFFSGCTAEAMTADRVRDYQWHRRKQGAEAATINGETSALSRMFQLAIRRGLLERMPLFPQRLDENPPREGFFDDGPWRGPNLRDWESVQSVCGRQRQSRRMDADARVEGCHGLGLTSGAHAACRWA